MTGLFEDHLSLDAVVAFADGEMPLAAYQRAAAHLAGCARCAAEVAEQTSASKRLRSAAAPAMPLGLFDALRSIPLGSGPLGSGPLGSIPLAAPVTGTGPGLAIDPDSGHAVHVDTGHVAPVRGRRFRLGAGVLVAGLAVGAALAAAAAERPAEDTSRQPTSDMARTPAEGHAVVTNPLSVPRFVVVSRGR